MIAENLKLLFRNGIFTHIVPHLDIDYEEATQMNANGSEFHNLESQVTEPHSNFEQVSNPVQGFSTLNIQDSEEENHDSKIKRNEIDQCYICLQRLPNLNHYSEFIKTGEYDVESLVPEKMQMNQKNTKKKDEFLKYLKDHNLHMALSCKHISCQPCVQIWMKSGDFCGLCKTKYLIEDYPVGHIPKTTSVTDVTNPLGPNIYSGMDFENRPNIVLSQINEAEISSSNNISPPYERIILIWKRFSCDLINLQSLIIICVILFFGFFLASVLP